MADEPASDIVLAEPQPSTAPEPDVAMGDGTDIAQPSRELPFADSSFVEPRAKFADYLGSPIVTLIVGSGEAETILTAHQALLVKSPYFSEACAAFNNDGSPRQVELPTDDIDAVGCFLEYLYTGDYFPRKIPGQKTLETDPSIPDVDETGDQLLKHARTYTLAEKFGVDKLKALASRKIHCVNSTAKGEVAYARYVYSYTSKNDTAIRAPVANFWATRSHTLRAEAEDEFRALCLEHPQFGYDVLTRVLDEKLKRESQSRLQPSAVGPGRKRARHSNV